MPDEWALVRASYREDSNVFCDPTNRKPYDISEDQTHSIQSEKCLKKTHEALMEAKKTGSKTIGS